MEETNIIILQISIPNNKTIPNIIIQGRHPRLNAIKNDDGTFTNRLFEDMDSFLSREEFEKEMIVKVV
jgi:hypothetical protein